MSFLGLWGVIRCVFPFKSISPGHLRNPFWSAVGFTLYATKACFIFFFFFFSSLWPATNLSGCCPQFRRPTFLISHGLVLARCRKKISRGNAEVGWHPPCQRAAYATSRPPQPRLFLLVTSVTESAAVFRHRWLPEGGDSSPGLFQEEVLVALGSGGVCDWLPAPPLVHTRDENNFLYHKMREIKIAS